MYLCTSTHPPLHPLFREQKCSQICLPTLRRETSGLEGDETSVFEHGHLLPAHLPDPEQLHSVPWSAPLLMPEGGGQPKNLVLQAVESAPQNGIEEYPSSSLLTAGVQPRSQNC